MGRWGRTRQSAPALALDEAEATFQAVVDPYARADFFLAFSPEGVEIEEGFLTLTSLPGGLLAKVGILKEQVGKVNTLHAHSLPWVDEPLMIQNLFGGDEGLADAGISVSKLILNPFMFLEATGEVYQGNSSLFTSHKPSDVSWVGRLRGYRDVTESTNVDVGGSVACGHNDVGPDFTTRLVGIDATVRYRPLRRAIYRRFQGRTNLWSRRGRRRQRQRLRHVCERRVSVREAVVRRRPLRLVRTRLRRLARRQGAIAHADVLAERVQPDPRPARRTWCAEGVTANEALFQFLFNRRPRGAYF